MWPALRSLKAVQPGSFLCCLPLDQCLSNQVCRSCRALLSAASKGVVFIAGFSLQKHYIATDLSIATIEGFPLLPIDNVWNLDISTLFVDRYFMYYIPNSPLWPVYWL